MVQGGSAEQTIENAILAKRVELLELEARTSSASVPPAAKNWRSMIVEFLVLPAAVIAIVVNITQVTGNLGSAQKTEAETQQIKTAEIKTRVEIEQLLEGLAEKKTQGIKAYQKELDSTIPRLKDAVQKLREIENASAKQPVITLLAKSAALAIVFHSIGLIFDIITSFGLHWL